MISLDLIYHLVEDETYEKYMHDLFDFAKQFVIIYAWDIDKKQTIHVRHRNFSSWIKKHYVNWHLIKHIISVEIPTACDFFIYEKKF